MRKLSVFNFITLDGYYKGLAEDINWHDHDAESAEFSVQNMKSRNALLFGRVTYELMASFWPTPAAAQTFPEVAIGMNEAEKIVCSRTLRKVSWNNTRVLAGDLISEIRKLKQSSGLDITILGSGSIVAQLAAYGLIDDYMFMLDPIALGTGSPLFQGLPAPLHLHLTKVKAMRSGKVVLRYNAKA